MSTPIPLQLSRLTLFALAGLGVYTLQIAARTNNLFTRMEHYQSKNYLSDGVTSFSPVFTGVKSIDDTTAFVLEFFWPIIDGKNLALSLCSFAFAGQVVAAWTLLMIEGRRRGGGWGIVSFTSIFALLGQLLGLGFVAPLYLLLHSFHPLSLQPTPPTHSSSLTSTLAAIPATILLSYILPITAMSLASPTQITFERKLLAHNLWQIFPLTSALTHGFLSMIWPYNPPSTPPNTLRYLRFAYKFALAVSVPAHLSSISLSGAAYLFPNLFESSAAAALQPGNVFMPPTAVFEGRKVSTVAEGALWFIQWDYALSGTAFLVWGVMMRQAGRRVNMSREGFGLGGLLVLLVRAAVLGPMGAAVVYVWERDEAVFGPEQTVGVAVKKIQ